MLLNIGCGKKRLNGNNVLNIDIDLESYADVILDMSQTPWIYADCAIDKIQMYHFLEHCPNPKEILKECYRVLKVGGILDIHVPHSSCVAANGCLLYFKTYSFNSIKDYCNKLQLFKTIHQRLIWLPHYEWLPIQWLIDLSPRFCERFWCYLIGGITEVQWTGIKIWKNFF